jgi:hypothetical protein
MKVRVRAAGEGTDGGTCSWVERRLLDVLGPLGRSVLRAAVRVAGSPRGRGGRASCSIEVRLRPGGRVMVFETGGSVIEATERAFDAIASAVTETLRRVKSVPRGAPAAFRGA